MPDICLIMDSLVRNTYQSKIDMTDAYEQIHVEMDSVPLMAFTTPWGTYISNVLQQGDCNGPSTFQRVVSWALREEIRLTIHVWFNDIFTGTDSVLKHNEKLMWVYLHLKEEQLYISHKKFEPFAPVLDILGCKVDTYYMLTLTKWPKSETGPSQDTIMRFFGSLVLWNIWHVLCQTLAHSQVCCRQSAATTCLLDGPCSIRNVLMKSKQLHAKHLFSNQSFGIFLLILQRRIQLNSTSA